MSEQTKANFKLDEVIELKGYLFKVVLIDAITGKIALKQISPAEAKILRQEYPAA